MCRLLQGSFNVESMSLCGGEVLKTNMSKISLARMEAQHAEAKLRPAARVTHVLDRTGVRISAYRKDKHFILLTDLGKASCDHGKTPARSISFPPAYTSPPGWQKQIRVRRRSVTMYMLMARGLVVVDTTAAAGMGIG